jgi:hypothetical protein
MPNLGLRLADEETKQTPQPKFLRNLHFCKFHRSKQIPQFCKFHSFTNSTANSKFHTITMLPGPVLQLRDQKYCQILNSPPSIYPEKLIFDNFCCNFCSRNWTRTKNGKPGFSNKIMVLSQRKICLPNFSLIRSIATEIENAKCWPWNQRVPHINPAPR